MRLLSVGTAATRCYYLICPNKATPLQRQWIQWDTCRSSAIGGTDQHRRCYTFSMAYRTITIAWLPRGATGWQTFTASRQEAARLWADLTERHPPGGHPASGVGR